MYVCVEVREWKGERRKEGREEARRKTIIRKEGQDGGDEERRIRKLGWRKERYVKC